MKTLFRAVTVSISLLLLCGLVFPLGMTGISQILFNYQANGSIIENSGKAVGSELLGQNFTDARFFHGRVSAYNYNTYEEENKITGKDGKTAYAGVSSGSSNLAPSNPELVERVQKDIDKFIKANPEVKIDDIPTDLLTSSGSGLDPHISPKAAIIQIPAISKATGISTEELTGLVNKNIESKQLGIFGEQRVNILRVNIEIMKKLQ